MLIRMFAATLLFAAILSFTDVASATSRNCENHPWPYNNSLLPGEKLLPGQSLQSSTAQLMLQNDGNLVLTRLNPRATMWSTNTAGMGVSSLAFDAEGALCLYNLSGTVWRSPIKGAAIGVVQDDCNFALYRKAPLEHVLWSAGVPTCLTVHIIAHSHDDVGWKLSPERYYDGCNITGLGVRYIITSVVESLAANPNRTFNQVEMYFFHRWWLEQNASTKQLVKELVKRGQLEFVNAGWSMHDEACVHHEGAISNMAIGAQFLADIFPEAHPHVSAGWHIDPFGHASSTPRLMAEIGFDGFVFTRQDEVQRKHMIEQKLFQNVWMSSGSLGDRVSMFTSIMFDGYGTGCKNAATLLEAMCLSRFCCFTCMTSTLADANDWATHEEWNRKGRFAPRDAKPLDGSWSLISWIAEGYALMLRMYAEPFRTQHIMVPWGGDFRFQLASLDFELMDAVIREIQSNYTKYGLNIMYSTPSRYLKAVEALGYVWPENYDDYFVDADDDHSYWSGFFTSRPAFKAYERYAMNERSAVESALSSVMFLPNNTLQMMERVSVLQRACGVSQHHDGITGTQRKSVVDQNNFIIADGLAAADSVLSDVFSKAAGVEGGVWPCHYANLSYCPATDPLARMKNVSLYVYNPLMRSRHEIVTVPIPTSDVVAFHRRRGAEEKLVSDVSSTWILTTTEDDTSPEASHPHPFQITFALDLLPNELVEVVLVGRNHGSSRLARAEPMMKSRAKGLSISNEFYTMEFGEDMMPKSVTNRRTSLTSPVRENVLFYYPMPPINSTQASGAYIFRTSSPDEQPSVFRETAESLSVVRGLVCEEARQVLHRGQRIHQAFRLCRGQPYIEMVTGVGELDPGELGLEVIVKISTDVASESVWYADNYGLELEKRVRDRRPNYPFIVTEKVASNYFPSNVFAMINDTSKRGLGVIADRTRAAASLKDGELEFLVHRRLLFDDRRGVSEALNESTRLLSTSWLVLNSDDMMRDVRVGSLLMTHRPILRFGAAASRLPPFDGFDGSAPSLPPSVHLHTRALLAPQVVLVRLQHLYAVGEERGASHDGVSVNLTSVMPQWTAIRSVVETEMNGVEPLSSMQRLPFRSCDASTHTVRTIPSRPRRPISPNSTLVTLLPMEIRTFRIEFDWVYH